MSKIIDGKKLAEDIQNDIYRQIKSKGLTPGLAVILVGDDPASKLYVSLKKKAAQEVGIEFHEYLLEADTPQDKILECIDFLNKDEKIDAILVQLPLPAGFDTDKIINKIDPAKDVDGFHPENIKKLLSSQTDFIPGLPLGIIKLLESTGENLAQKSAVIIAKSKIFYEPLAKLLKDKNIIATIASPKDTGLKNKTINADILITAIGQPFFITANMIKPDAIVIDIGTNKVGDYTVGDVDYTAAFEVASHITPVPGGVGPMTVAMLLYNTLKLAEKK